jgi:hypothetical protein
MAAPLFAVVLRRGELEEAAVVLAPAWARAEPFDDARSRRPGPPAMSCSNGPGPWWP